MCFFTALGLLCKNYGQDFYIKEETDKIEELEEELLFFYLDDGQNSFVLIQFKDRYIFKAC